ncbi:MAG: hypothetical protein ACFHWZ_07125 [Phycisphaerales bacterium]
MSTKAVVLALWSVGLLVVGAVLFWMNLDATLGYDPQSVDDVERSLALSEAVMLWSMLGVFAGPVILIAVLFHALQVKKKVAQYPKLLILAAFVSVYCLGSSIYNLWYLAAALSSM